MTWMIANGIEKKAWDEFGKWLDQWRDDHPDDERDDYELALIYPDGDE